ncbi:hypothetical protein CTheo_5619 [Ceratobasidium theobromae]|uniref:Peptidase C14 caspase domain-containing protein n=1 Tax=Ceratobasidium theobromae TaxID=1582974 RepID=A0A5N5QGP5_9AGAM|nr:hypothetical protein CTheo_5619 [Ceratobasidium theobromae]
MVPPPSPRLRETELCNSALPPVLGLCVESTSPLPMLQGPQNSQADHKGLQGSFERQPSASDPTPSRCHTTIRAESQCSNASFMTAPSVGRRLLIIGGGRKNSSQAGYAGTFSRLDGIPNDRDNLRSAFEPRGYSVHTMVDVEYNRVQILQNIAHFLSTAVEGDIRVIVFTGHATRIGCGDDRRIVLIPSNCPAEEDAISANSWYETVRTHAAPGVVVISIFATCYSGAIPPSLDSDNAGTINTTLKDFAFHLEKLHTQHPESASGPTHIALTSSGDAQSSYEYFAPSRSNTPRLHDHFLWALAEAVKRPNIGDWEPFVETLQNSFNFVRAVSLTLRPGSNESNGSYEFPNNLDWVLSHPQSPRLAIPGGRLPVRA